MTVYRPTKIICSSATTHSITFRLQQRHQANTQIIININELEFSNWRLLNHHRLSSVDHIRRVTSRRTRGGHQ